MLILYIAAGAFVIGGATILAAEVLTSKTRPNGRF